MTSDPDSDNEPKVEFIQVFLRKLMTLTRLTLTLKVMNLIRLTLILKMTNLSRITWTLKGFHDLIVNSNYHIYYLYLSSKLALAFSSSSPSLHINIRVL